MIEVIVDSSANSIQIAEGKNDGEWFTVRLSSSLLLGRLGLTLRTWDGRTSGTSLEVMDDNRSQLSDELFDDNKQEMESTQVTDPHPCWSDNNWPKLKPTAEAA